MNIAVTTWGNRISPVFDSARTLLIVRIEEGAIVDKSYKSFAPSPAGDLIETMKKMEVSTLICGAISTQPADILKSNDIQLISFVTGNVQTILNSFATRHCLGKEYKMPGCNS